MTRMLEEVFVETFAPAPLPPFFARMSGRLLGTLLAPAFARAAARKGTPGIEFHQAASRLALKWFLQNPAPGMRRYLFNLIGNPLVLTRYQEFDFAWRQLPGKIERYLDVSSPAIFPLRLMAERKDTRGTLLNPDANDLQVTRQLIRAAGLEARCSVSPALINEFDAADGTFDIITSLSVVEHIPSNRPAIEKLWRLLRSKGALILTVPCAARGYALYTNADHFGLLEQDARGRVFLEYLYDDAMLQEFIFDVTGAPASMEVYGEVRAGFLREQLQRRWSGQYTRFWEEPVLMGREFQRFDSIARIPGEGVVCMQFTKP